MQPLARVTAAPVAERCGGLARPRSTFTWGAFLGLAIYEIDGYPRPLAGVFPQPTHHQVALGRQGGDWATSASDGLASSM